MRNLSAVGTHRSGIVREGDISFRTLEAALLRVGLALGLAVLTTGCQLKYWYQGGKTFDQCKADHADCQIELGRRARLHHRSSYSYRFLENCMQQKGYKLVAEKKLPLDAKREDLEVPLEVPWYHAYGVAGALPPRPGSVPRDVARAESAAPARGAPRSVVSPRPPPRQGLTSSSP